MSYLLDVNALIAMGYKKHEFHQRVTLWAKGKNLLTCSISEIGFVRVLSGLPEAEITTALCRQLLTQMKADWKMQLLLDNRSAETLPDWVRGAKQVTDGHLLDLAQANTAQLATTDAGIPGGFLIPNIP
jgi:predicted nucleic acid-binding protein